MRTSTNEVIYCLRCSVCVYELQQEGQRSIELIISHCSPTPTAQQTLVECIIYQCSSNVKYITIKRTRNHLFYIADNCLTSPWHFDLVGVHTVLMHITILIIYLLCSKMSWTLVTQISFNLNVDLCIILCLCPYLYSPLVDLLSSFLWPRWMSEVCIDRSVQARLSNWLQAMFDSFIQ